MSPVCVELFAGAGGLGLGLERAGFHVALAVELERDFAATYAANHPQTKVLAADIKTLDLVEEVSALGVNKVHLLAGGPPCQGFSTVGSKNFEDPRNSLFYEFLKAVKNLDPDYILFENVAGFRRLYSGFAYDTLLRELGSLGYTATSAVLEGADFGLPQKRQRTIVLGAKTSLPKVHLPLPTHSDGGCMLGTKPWLGLYEAISDLPSLGPGSSSSRYASPPLNSYQATMRSGAKQLTEHNSTNYGEKMQEILSLIPPGGSVKDLPERLRPKSCFSNTYARLIPDKPSPTITRNFGTPSSSRCVHPFQNRALSTREGARIQGFPDNYHFVGGKGSKNLQIGNAVPPVFGEIIARQILSSGQ